MTDASLVSLEQKVLASIASLEKPHASIASLRRPIRASKLRPDHRDAVSRDLLQAIRAAFEHGDQRSKVLAEALAYSLIGREIANRMLDPEHGAIPNFVGKAKQSF